MKKLLSLFLAFLMVLSLTACGVPDVDWTVESPDDPLVTYGNPEKTTNGSLETEGDPDSSGNEDDSKESVEVSDDIIEFITEEYIPPVESTEPTDGTETAPIETEENELPLDFFIPEETTSATEAVPVLDENGTYTTMEDVALYLYTYHKLPKNFITKSEARALGWEGGYLEPYAPGKCIGGDRFGNYEGLLPTDRKYTECDIDTLGARSRGAKRIVFSNDYALIYYTDDHYESFTLLYGEE